MLNTYHASLSIDGPPIVPGKQFFHVYRPHLTLCFLEKDIFFCYGKRKSSNFPQGKNIPPRYEQRPKVGRCEVVFYY